MVQSSYGVGESRDRLRLADRIVFHLLLRPQIEDSERQEARVHASGLDWTTAVSTSKSATIAKHTTTSR